MGWRRSWRRGGRRVVLAALVQLTALGFAIIQHPTTPVGWASRALTICALSVIAYRLAVPVLIRREPVSELREVFPGLYQGALGDEPLDFERSGIDVVVDLRASQEIVEPPQVPIGRQYLHWPIPDRDPPDPDEVTAVARFVADRLGSLRVAVCCTLGRNRSGLVIRAVATELEARARTASEEAAARMFNASFVPGRD